MRAVFFVFSGTGNTMRVSEVLAEKWREYGHEADIVPIRAEAQYPDLKEYDIVLVGYPVHAFNAPAAVLKFLKKLPAGDTGNPKPCYLLRTSGEPLKMNNAAGIMPKRILKKKGYKVLGEFRYVMPYNIIFRHSDGMAARMWQDANLRLTENARTMSEGGGEVLKNGPWKRLVSFVLRIEHTAMPLIGRSFHAKKKLCVGCGLCEKACPQGNIEMKNGRPKFKGKCVGCMGCAFSCPKDAIRTGVLNAWRVNGAYPLDGEPVKDNEIGRYCRRAYLRYFHETEQKALRMQGVEHESIAD